MIVWPKYIVSWICSLISTDGNITKANAVDNFIQIRIVFSVEKDWVTLVQKTLSRYNIKTSIPKPQLPKKEHRFPNQRPIYTLRLFKKDSGVNQYQTLRDNIEYWGVTDLIVNRKYEVLCEFTKPLSNGNKALFNKKLTTKEFLEL